MPSGYENSVKIMFQPEILKERGPLQLLSEMGKYTKKFTYLLYHVPQIKKFQPNARAIT